MNALILPASRNTPSIFFEPASSRFEMSGISIPENASEYYQPVFEWLTMNLPLLKDGSTFHFRLSYFNSTSLKAIYQVLKLIKEATITGPPINVNWYVEAEDEFMRESAEMFQQLLDMRFKLIDVPHDEQSARAAG
jgi:hypothetical protein